MLLAFALACLPPHITCTEAAQALHRVGDRCRAMRAPEAVSDCYRRLPAAWASWGERCLP